MGEHRPVRSRSIDPGHTLLCLDRVALSELSRRGNSHAWTSVWPRRRSMSAQRETQPCEVGPMRNRHFRLDFLRTDGPLSRQNRPSNIRYSRGHSSDDWASSSSDIPSLPMTHSWLKALDSIERGRSSTPALTARSEGDAAHMCLPELSERQSARYTYPVPHLSQLRLLSPGRTFFSQSPKQMPSEASLAPSSHNDAQESASGTSPTRKTWPNDGSHLRVNKWLHSANGANNSLEMDFDALMFDTPSSSDSMSICCPSDVLEEGDHIGPGLFHDGQVVETLACSEMFCKLTEQKNIELKVLSCVGHGTHAVVYNVEEITPLHDLSTDLGATPKATWTPPVSRTPLQSGCDTNTVDYQPAQYALKCLCKREMSSEMQGTLRLEACIHQSIPQHPGVITLYTAFETRDWLFLVLEYCPGQDLLCWMEQGRDLDPVEYPTTDGDEDTYTSMRGDLPSKWSRYMNDPGVLFYSKRLQLISHVFCQMCEAVQFCHDNGISHRDIKPDNFIVMDTRGSGDKYGTNTSQKDVVVKLTDFGLATLKEECDDFNCGSKPYMAFECRHNITPTYDPRQADVWSLGVVLINLIFHRSPFKEPSVHKCCSFASFSIQPIEFLTKAFHGISVDVARFLTLHVFCDVTHSRKRISAREFAQWAAFLPRHFGMVVNELPHS